MIPGVAKSMTCLSGPVSSAPTVNGMSSECWITLSGWLSPTFSECGSVALLQQHALNQADLNNLHFIYFQRLHIPFHQ